MNLDKSSSNQYQQPSALRVCLDQVKPFIVSFSLDSKGSRILQNSIVLAEQSTREIVFQQLFPYSQHLMKNQFANFVLQEFFNYDPLQSLVIEIIGSDIYYTRYSLIEMNAMQNQSSTTEVTKPAPSPKMNWSKVDYMKYRDESFVLRLACLMKDRMIDLSFDKHSCRVVQRSLELLPFDVSTQLIQELQPCIILAVNDHNANHVIQKIVRTQPPNSFLFLLEALADIHVVKEILTNQFSCRVVQHIIDNSPVTMSGTLIRTLINQSNDLVTSSYGNYIMQKIILSSYPNASRDILVALSGRIAELCLHKYSSNVIEKICEYGTDADRRSIINEFMRFQGGSQVMKQHPIVSLLLDTYANYVVQKVLICCGVELRESLCRIIINNAQILSSSMHWRHIITSLNKVAGSISDQHLRQQVLNLVSSNARYLRGTTFPTGNSDTDSRLSPRDFFTQ
ncbi:MAG: hypothetical protein EZS28_018443 [Streblomastix strix]|uniref:PUM-HD domain-containing protein n=1 Tax=Streblomastix strix TaxID=222440 RepID=A0A5J4VUF3_9EUKA|nr:MAG: hypothetical protein EZS28_018443 [Streblomastix strix]